MVVIKLASPTRAVKPNSRNLQSTEDQQLVFWISERWMLSSTQPSVAMKTRTPMVVNNPGCFLQQQRLRPKFQIELAPWFTPLAKRREFNDRASENNRGMSLRREGDFEISYWREAPLSNRIVASQNHKVKWKFELFWKNLKKVKMLLYYERFLFPQSKGKDS